MTKEEDYSIFNKEILGGIKSAVKRGESLKEAMMTFYQAGYDRGEIETAARDFLDKQTQSPQINAPSSNLPLPARQSQKKQEQKKALNENTKLNQPNTQNKPLGSPKSATSPIKKLPAFRKVHSPIQQKVSAYGVPKKPKVPKSNALTITLTIILLLLLGVLLVVFVYKDSFINFINNLFG